jgi:DNA-binding XRE family transcriptional regulator
MNHSAAALDVERHPCGLYEQILRLRMQLGLSQAEFARAIGAARQAVST